MTPAETIRAAILQLQNGDIDLPTFQADVAALVN